MILYLLLTCNVLQELILSVLAIHNWNYRGGKCVGVILTMAIL